MSVTLVRSLCLVLVFLVSRRCCLSSSTVVSGALSLCLALSCCRSPFTGSVAGAHEMRSLERTAWLCVQPEVSGGTDSMRVYVLQTGVRGTLQAKYWEAASPGPISGVFSVRIAFLDDCAAGVSCDVRNVGLACSLWPQGVRQRCP